MIKKILSLLLFAILSFSLFSCGKSDKDYDDYCYKINKIIKDKDFTKGEVTDNKILLYEDDEIIFEENFEEYDKSYKIKYIRKEENRMFFILHGAVDDEGGIVFVNGDENGVMDGTASLERIGGNSYKYKTYK